eukprot:m.28200 g.28200  ORF g.28200 m.28200 type:complete len:814 (-) comp13558_c0_seq2:186-2627(-)
MLSCCKRTITNSDANFANMLAMHSSRVVVGIFFKTLLCSCFSSPLPFNAEIWPQEAALGSSSADAAAAAAAASISSPFVHDRTVEKSSPTVLVDFVTWDASSFHSAVEIISIVRSRADVHDRKNYVFRTVELSSADAETPLIGLNNSGSATIKTRLLSNTPTGNYTIQYFLLAGSSWTSRIAHTSTINVDIIERTSSLEGFFYDSIVYKFHPTYVRVGVLIHLNYTVLKSLRGNFLLYLRLIHRATGINYEFNSTSQDRTPLTNLSETTEFIEISGRMLSAAPLGEYYGEVYLAPSNTDQRLPILSSTDAPAFESLREELVDISIGFELQDLHSRTSNLVQALFIPAAPLLGYPTTVTFTVQYAVTSAIRVDIIPILQVADGTDDLTNEISVARLMNGSTLENLSTRGSIDIFVEFKDSVFPETVYEMRVHVVQNNVTGGDVIARSEPSFITPNAPDYILIERYNPNVMKHSPTYLHMEIHYRTSQPLRSVDVIVVVKSVSNASAPSIVYTALDTTGLAVHPEHGTYAYITLQLLSSAPPGSYTATAHLLPSGGDWEDRFDQSTPVHFSLQHPPSNIVITSAPPNISKSRHTTYPLEFFYTSYEASIVDIVVVVEHVPSGANFEFRSTQTDGASLSAIPSASRYLYVSVRLLSTAPLGMYRVLCHLLRGGQGWSSRHAVSDLVAFELLPERDNMITVVDFGGGAFVVKARPTVHNVTMRFEASEPTVDIVVLIRNAVDGTSVEFNSRRSDGSALTGIDATTGGQDIIIQIRLLSSAMAGPYTLQFVVLPTGAPWRSRLSESTPIAFHLMDTLV